MSMIVAQLEVYLIINCSLVPAFASETMIQSRNKILSTPNASMYAEVRPRKSAPSVSRRYRIPLRTSV